MEEVTGALFSTRRGLVVHHERAEQPWGRARPGRNAKKVLAHVPVEPYALELYMFRVSFGLSGVPFLEGLFSAGFSEGSSDRNSGLLGVLGGISAGLT